MKKVVVNSLGKTAMLSLVAMSAGCSHINVNQIAYEALRQEDCRINQLDDFCSRNFAHEFREYELMRRDFMRSQQQEVWRASQDESRIVANNVQ